MPAVMFMIVMSKEIILLVLGSQWIEAAPIFTFLGVSALLQPICNTCGWLFISQGRANNMFRWGLIGGTIAIVSIIAGLAWGAVGVAASYSISGICIRTPLLLWYVGRKGPVRTNNVYKAIGIPAYIASFVLLGLLALRLWAGIPNPLLALVYAFGLTLAIMLLGACIMKSGTVILGNIVTSASLLFKPKEKKSDNRSL